MKKVFITLMAFVAMSANAQLLKVASIEQLQVPSSSADSKVAGISPDGSYVLLTSMNNAGLQKYNVATGELETLSTAAGAGYNVVISSDGNDVVYRETTMGKDKLNRSSLVRKNIQTKKATTLVKPTRDLNGFTVKGNTILSVEKRKLRVQAIDEKQKAEKELPIVSIQDRQLMLTMNGETRVLSPNGQGKSYIWPSVSPDGTKVCYYVAGNGAWVANIDGTNPQFIGRDCRAAKWYNNEIIIGMADKDDGHVQTASDIVAYNLQGEHQVLTSGLIAMYPYVAANGKQIVFSTDKGETYLIHINQ